MTITDEWVADALEAIQLPRRLRLRLTRNGLTVVPVTQAHLTTQRRIANQIEARMPGWMPIGEFKILPAREGYKPEPDVSVLPEDQWDSGSSEFDEGLLPFVVEVVSPESKNRDYSTKPEHYAMRGIPAYLIVDVLSASWQLLTQPENGTYQCTQSGPFGKDIQIPVADQTLVLDSSQFMRV
ncbi:Uma2 family endonuclease [Streptomyces yaanensis]|uniref:Uma2 family endonuclease n=1 Tax=Streptomyces yaanensis TaxID=1142239 RepID=A0ABV7SJK2_9ACTN|nr:Uma2 family endonuclease [Streptomyces sp. CGMCC 4.7035]WNC01500.1 Uma2 family endonuclease [Streptomyces sp. CGMCC 4.7035]